MKRRHKLLIYATLSIVPVCFSTTYAQSSGNSDGSAAGSGNSGETSKPSPPRQKFTVKLPEEYRGKDTDKDNQIGMYEWPKSDWAKFRELDLNGDGFLTPRELSHKSTRGKGGSSRSGDRSGSSGGTAGVAVASTSGGSSSSAPAADAKTEPAGPPTSLSSSEVEKQAENFFKSTDKDDNGKITEEEVKKSLLVRVKFDKAGIKPSYPLNRDEFIRLYVQAAGGAK